MPSTHLQLRFRLWGVDVDPEKLTAVTGIPPSDSFHVGERNGRAASLVAGWEWDSEWGSDVQPLLDEMLSLLGPHVPTWHAYVNEGASATLSVVGEVRGSVVDTPVEAARRNFDVPKVRPFEPFFDCDRVLPFFDVKVVQFLAAAGAALATHIDVELEPDSGEDAD